MARERATDTSALVDAAAAVFRAKGYHNATIDDIAEAARISRPTVYKYTKSKQHLLDLIVEKITGAMDEHLRDVMASTTDPALRLRRLVAAHVETAVAHRTFYAIVLSEELQVSDAGRQRFRTWARGVTAEFQQLIEQCLRPQAEPPAIDPFIAANLVLSMLNSLYRWYDPAGSTTPDQLVDEILALLAPLSP